MTCACCCICAAVPTAVPTAAQTAVPASLQLADRLNRVAEGCQRPQPLSVLLQVNTSGEETKHGCEPDEVSARASRASGLHHGMHARQTVSSGPVC
jgi:uncharacterized pyridoxal phosphate-containing UPF0001 family protein